MLTKLLGTALQKAMPVRHLTRALTARRNAAKDRCGRKKMANGRLAQRMKTPNVRHGQKAMMKARSSPPSGGGIATQKRLLSRKRSRSLRSDVTIRLRLRTRRRLRHPKASLSPRLKLLLWSNLLPPKMSIRKKLSRRTPLYRMRSASLGATLARGQRIPSLRMQLTRLQILLGHQKSRMSLPSKSPPPLHLKWIQRPPSQQLLRPRPLR